MRLRIDLAYDGTDFRGWAAQTGLRTVQGEVESALATVLRTPDISVTCAGRTDAGVHARGQVVHVDLAEPPSFDTRSARIDDSGDQSSRLGVRLNGVLPPDVRVRRVREAAPGFDARFAALWRRYAYRIADRAETLDPLRRGHVLAWRRPLDEAAMNRAAERLLGEQDFAAFCRKREGATTVRTLLDLHWERESDGLLVATVKADAFCHNMVRALMGCLVAVGEGRRDVEWPQQVLRAGVRDSAVTVMQAHALTLEEVAYPPDHELAERARLTRRRRDAPDGDVDEQS